MIHPTLWQRDVSVSQCERCNQPFSIIHRRHHCRHCGHIFCQRCSPHRVWLQPITDGEIPLAAPMECVESISKGPSVTDHTLSQTSYAVLHCTPRCTGPDSIDREIHDTVHSLRGNRSHSYPGSSQEVSGLHDTPREPPQHTRPEKGNVGVSALESQANEGVTTDANSMSLRLWRMRSIAVERRRGELWFLCRVCTDCLHSLQDTQKVSQCGSTADCDRSTAQVTEELPLSPNSVGYASPLSSMQQSSLVLTPSTPQNTSQKPPNSPVRSASLGSSVWAALRSQFQSGSAPSDIQGGDSDGLREVSQQHSDGMSSNDRATQNPIAAAEESPVLPSESPPPVLRAMSATSFQHVAALSRKQRRVCVILFDEREQDRGGDVTTAIRSTAGDTTTGPNPGQSTSGVFSSSLNASVGSAPQRAKVFVLHDQLFPAQPSPSAPLVAPETKGAHATSSANWMYPFTRTQALLSQLLPRTYNRDLHNHYVIAALFDQLHSPTTSRTVVGRTSQPPQRQPSLTRRTSTPTTPTIRTSPNAVAPLATDPWSQERRLRYSGDLRQSSELARSSSTIAGGSSGHTATTEVHYRDPSAASFSFASTCNGYHDSDVCRLFSADSTSVTQEVGCHASVGGAYTGGANHSSSGSTYGAGKPPHRHVALEITVQVMGSGSGATTSDRPTAHDGVMDGVSPGLRPSARTPVLSAAACRGTPVNSIQRQLLSRPVLTSAGHLDAATAQVKFTPQYTSVAVNLEMIGLTATTHGGHGGRGMAGAELPFSQSSGRVHDLEALTAALTQVCIGVDAYVIVVLRSHLVTRSSEISTATPTPASDARQGRQVQQCYFPVAGPPSGAHSGTAAPVQPFNGQHLLALHHLLHECGGQAPPVAVMDVIPLAPNKSPPSPTSAERTLGDVSGLSASYSSIMHEDSPGFYASPTLSDSACATGPGPITATATPQSIGIPSGRNRRNSVRAAIQSVEAAAQQLGVWYSRKAYREYPASAMPSLQSVMPDVAHARNDTLAPPISPLLQHSLEAVTALLLQREYRDGVA